MSIIRLDFIAEPIVAAAIRSHHNIVRTPGKVGLSRQVKLVWKVGSGRTKAGPNCGEGGEGETV